MGHGGSIGENTVRGYFYGGWFAAVDDSMRLMKDTMAEYPDVPYILFGHSMGSFMARTILAKYPDSGISAAIICGTGWQPTFALPALAKVIDAMGKKAGEEAPNEQLDKMIFGGYTKGFENVRTPKDWLTRDSKIVDAYIADPLCGFVASSGLLRDMMLGIHYIQQPKHMQNMKKHLPVFFIAGDKDPVGANGKGVKQAAQAFKKAGMVNVALKLYPDCRHEILNELNKQEVYEDITGWIAKVTELG
jgi:alpha-beta hydrolase superfamily lysophospholipase